MKGLSEGAKNAVLNTMISILDRRRTEIIEVNKKDLDAYDPTDRAMYDRLVINDAKIDGMMLAVTQIMQQPDPIGRVRFDHIHDNGMRILNKTAAFGTILIIYESRPDVTIEAAVVAFKSGNKILLKGGKEAVHSNQILVECWHEALRTHKMEASWIRLLQTDRKETQAFLSHPPEPLDLIVPRGGEGLIAFVKQHARCAVLISGRGNNFLYVDKNADWEQSLAVILNAKIQKISACNALDKVLIDASLPNKEACIKQLYDVLTAHDVEVLVDDTLNTDLPSASLIESMDVWAEEFLAMKICIGIVENMDKAIQRINEYSGGHSATIMTQDDEIASDFMDEVDVAAVYHNASTRFTDGGALGVGAELAISTDKLHHRGPLGLEQLVTNKWYIHGAGQVRE